MRAFVELAVPTLELQGPVYEFGALLVEGQDVRANLRNFFPGRQYLGCDMRPGPGVDRIEDLSQLSLPDECARTLLCFDTLEHVFEARRGVEEMLRVLAPGGICLFSTPLDFRIHNYPDDYWRLTPTCLDQLLAPLPATLVGSVGLESFPHSVLAVGAKAPVPASFLAGASALIEQYQAWLAAMARQERRRHGLRRALTAWARRKGERRRESEFHTARFWMRLPRGAAVSSLVASARGGLGASSGSRLV